MTEEDWRRVIDTESYLWQEREWEKAIRKMKQRRMVEDILTAVGVLAAAFWMWRLLQ